MLIATLIALLFLGSGANFMLDGLDQTKDNVKHQISDDSVREAALVVVKRLEDTAKDYAKADGKDEKALLKLIQDFDSSAAEVKANMDASFQQRLAYQKEMIALRFELKDKLSREQWEKVFSKDTSTK